MARKKSAKQRAEARLAKHQREEKVMTDAQHLAEDRLKAATGKQKREQKKVIKALEAELEAATIRTDFLDSLSDAPDPKPMKIRARRGQGKRHPSGTYAMLASDWHVGERVRPETVGWRNEYSPEIAQERAEQFFKSNLVMLNASRSAWDIRDLVLWMGGDLMTGYIHEEYLEENFLSPVEEALLAREIMIRGIDFLLVESDAERIIIVTNHGNHGRTGLKLKIASEAKNSFEWMLYHLIRSHYCATLENPGATKSQDGRLEFRIAAGLNNVVDLYGFRINFAHGHENRYGGGIGGISIPINKRIGRRAASVPIRWEGTELAAPHLYVHGHFHQLTYPGPSMGNGSLIGWNAFAEWISCPFEDPRQGSFVVDERYQIVNAFNPILVDKKRRK